jgi:hypothetical protein
LKGKILEFDAADISLEKDFASGGDKYQTNH